MVYLNTDWGLQVWQVRRVGKCPEMILSLLANSEGPYE